MHTGTHTLAGTAFGLRNDFFQKRPKQINRDPPKRPNNYVNTLIVMKIRRKRRQILPKDLNKSIETYNTGPITM